MNTTSLAENLHRLESLRRTDGGFYVLALHAFIETAAIEAGGFETGADFEELLAAWLLDTDSAVAALADSPLSITDRRNLVGALVREHGLLETVRHGFAQRASEEVRCATWNFLRLGGFAGWADESAITPLEASLDSWKLREAPAADEALNRIKDEAAASRNGSIGPEPPITALARLTHIARTRRDYGRAATRLAPEQLETLESLATEQDLLITGGAGTGKTRVLLEALARTLAKDGPELDLGQPTTVALVTFTKTLVKYDRYLTARLRPGSVMEGHLESSETFFWKKLRLKEPKHAVDYNLLRNLAAELNTTGVLTEAELYIEIEEFLFGLNITRDEYLDAAIPRRGLRTPLNLSDREKVWAIREDMEERMLSQGTYSKHFARLRLLHWLEEQPDGLVTHDSLYIDESQDMSAIELICLKKLAGRSLIMAGDTGQSIYGFINPYRRANLHLHQDQIRLLATNHRNTVPIHQMAEEFRRTGLEAGADPGPESHPFREGPDPEIHRMENPEMLADLLAARAGMYVRDLGYPPDALGILCSRTAHLSMMAGKLQAIGLESAVIKSESFDFGRPGAIRLSTLHSSKGLDFPVVLMYVPELPPAREIDPPYQDRLHRNLQYVAMSRGMDAVERFERETPV